MPATRSGPVRTCVGCRRTASKRELVRVVWTDGLHIDLDQTSPGRGAYLHPEPECVEQAVRRRAIGRALRQPGLDQAAIAAVLSEIRS